MPKKSVNLYADDCPDFVQAINDLQPVPGYCVFIDIVGSTKMKQQEPKEWIRLTSNFRAKAETWLGPFRPVKMIGDALMYYIEIADLVPPNNYSPLQIFDDLWKIATDKDEKLYPGVRVSASRCQNVYSITFMRDTQDYYGLEIDATVHMNALANHHGLAINKDFRDEVLADLDACGQHEQFKSCRTLSGPHADKMKNIPIEFYRAG